MRKFLLALTLCLASCQDARVEQPAAEPESIAVDFDEARRLMVDGQIRSRGVGAETVLAAKPLKLELLVELAAKAGAERLSWPQGL